MDHGKGVVGVAVGAKSGFSNATAFDLNGGLQVADGATEKSRIDLGDQVRRTNDHACDGDQLINI